MLNLNAFQCPPTFGMEVGTLYFQLRERERRMGGWRHQNQGTIFSLGVFPSILKRAILPGWKFLTWMYSHAHAQTKSLYIRRIKMYLISFHSMQNIWKQAINREKYISDDIVTSNGSREGGRIIVAVLYNNYCIGGFKGFVNKSYF